MFEFFRRMLGMLLILAMLRIRVFSPSFRQSSYDIIMESGGMEFFRSISEKRGRFASAVQGTIGRFAGIIRPWVMEFFRSIGEKRGRFASAVQGTIGRFAGTIGQWLIRRSFITGMK